MIRNMKIVHSTNTIFAWKLQTFTAIKFIEYILSSNQEFHFNFHLSYRTNSLIRKYVVSLRNTDKHYILNTISFYLRETDSKHYFFCPVSFDLKLAIHCTFYTFNCFITKNVEAIFNYFIYILRQVVFIFYVIHFTRKHSLRSTESKWMYNMQ